MAIVGYRVTPSNQYHLPTLTPPTHRTPQFPYPSQQLNLHIYTPCLLLPNTLNHPIIQLIHLIHRIHFGTQNRNGNQQARKLARKETTKDRTDRYSIQRQPTSPQSYQRAKTDPSCAKKTFAPLDNRDTKPPPAQHAPHPSLHIYGWRIVYTMHASYTQ